MEDSSQLVILINVEVRERHEKSQWIDQKTDECRTKRSDKELELEIKLKDTGQEIFCSEKAGQEQRESADSGLPVGLAVALAASKLALFSYCHEGDWPRDCRSGPWTKAVREKIVEEGHTHCLQKISVRFTVPNLDKPNSIHTGSWILR